MNFFGTDNWHTNNEIAMILAHEFIWHWWLTHQLWNHNKFWQMDLFGTDKWHTGQQIVTDFGTWINFVLLSGTYQIFPRYLIFIKRNSLSQNHLVIGNGYNQQTNIFFIGWSMNDWSWLDTDCGNIILCTSLNAAATQPVRVKLVSCHHNNCIHIWDHRNGHNSSEDEIIGSSCWTETRLTAFSIIQVDKKQQDQATRVTIIRISGLDTE